MEDAYERKPSPINLKPLSPRTTQTKVGEQPTGDAANKVLSGRKERTFSPRQLKISSKPTQETDGPSAPQGPTTKNLADKTTNSAADQAANKASKKGEKESDASETADAKQQRGKSQGHAARHQGHRQFSPVKQG